MEHPMDITTPRVRSASDTCDIYFIHTKVNHLLYTCPLVPFEDGILLDLSLVCIHRCERSYTFIEEESKKKRTSTPSKREAWKRRRKRQEEGNSSQATPCARACTMPTGPPCPQASWAPCARAHVSSLWIPCAHGLHLPRAHGPPCVMLRDLPLFYHFAPTYPPLCLELYILLHLLHLDLAKNRSRY